MKLTEIIKTFGPAMEMKYSNKILPGHKKAMSAMLKCRTEECGEVIVKCPDCGRIESFNHSCGHRSSPRCQNHVTTEWIKKQLKKLLPVQYFLITVTVPFELRDPIWRNQRVCYNALFSSSVHAMMEIAENKKYLGGEIGVTGILHTHARNLDFHPHVHFIVPGGAIDRKNKIWKKKRGKYLFPWQKLCLLFKGKFLAALKERNIEFTDSVYKKEWRVDMEDAGSGEKALLYLSKYLYKGVITEKRIKNNYDGKVTFTYTESKSKIKKFRTMKGEDFLFHVLQHVLPKGYRRCRDYGFLHGNAKKTLHLLQILLVPKINRSTEETAERPKFKCPKCGSNMLIIHQTFKFPQLTISTKEECRKIPV
jgi:hypothetical protein